MAERVGIFVDGENIVALEASEETLHLEKLLVDLSDHFRPVLPCLVVFPMRVPAHVQQRIGEISSKLPVTTILTRGDPDVALAVEGMRLLPELDHLVLVSGDGGLLPLVQAVQEIGKRATVVAPMRYTSAALSVAASDRLTPDQLMPSVAGLVAPGQGGDKTAAIVKLFQRARRRVVVMDPWTSEQTIRLMAFGAPDVDLILVAGRLTSEAQKEAAAVVDARGRLSLYQSGELHDRWFAVDDMWFHSGGSLKDLGRRWTRLSKIDDAHEIADTEAMLDKFTRETNRVRLR